jgi:hypothetical protein
MKLLFLRLYNSSDRVFKESSKSISELFDQWLFLYSLINAYLRATISLLQLQALLQTYRLVCMPPSREGRKVTRRHLLSLL